MKRVMIVFLAAILSVVSPIRASPEQVQVLAKLTAVYRAAKGVEAIAFVTEIPKATQVSPPVQDLGREILIAEDVASSAKEKQALAAYREAWDLYRASVVTLEDFEQASARVRESSGSPEMDQIRLLQAQGKVVQVRDQWIAARAQLLVAHTRYLGKPPASAESVDINASFDTASGETTRTLRQGGRIALDLRTASGAPIPVALAIWGSFPGRTGSPQVVRMHFVAGASYVAADPTVQLTREGGRIATAKIETESTGLWVEIPTASVTLGLSSLGGVVFGHAFSLTAAQQRALATLGK